MDNTRENPRISAIAAIGRNRELGKGGDLLWRIPDDLKRVKALTLGHPIVMGRSTFESLGRPLPGRTNIVVTRDNGYEAPGAVVVHSLDEALLQARATGTDEVFIFGGAQIYEQALPLTQRLYLTLIDATDDAADVFFPEYKALFSKEVECEERTTPEGLKYAWVALERAEASSPQA